MGNQFQVMMVRVADGSDQCHKADCKDLNKVKEMDKLQDFANVAKAKEAWNAHDEDNWGDWVRVMPCVKEEGK